MAILSLIKFLLLLVLVTLFIKPSLQKTDYDYEICDTGPVNVSHVELSSKAFGRRKSITIKIFGSTDKRLDGAYYDAKIKVGPVKMRSETSDLCHITTCPVPIGNFVTSYTASGRIPPAKYRIQIGLFDKDDEVLTCINIRLRIK